MSDRASLFKGAVAPNRAPFQGRHAIRNDPEGELAATFDLHADRGSTRDVVGTWRRAGRTRFAQAC
jgi:hypothetical protein